MYDTNTINPHFTHVAFLLTTETQTSRKHDQINKIRASQQNQAGKTLSFWKNLWRAEQDWIAARMWWNQAADAFTEGYWWLKAPLPALWWCTVGYLLVINLLKELEHYTHNAITLNSHWPWMKTTLKTTQSLQVLWRITYEWKKFYEAFWGSTGSLINVLQWWGNIIGAGDYNLVAWS